jgi:hypothetical protein
MKESNISMPELNALVHGFPCEDGPLPPAKNWVRVDVGDLETYVGDRLYVVTLVETLPDSVEEIKQFGASAEATVIKYLQGEGFIDNEFLYIGLQRFDLQNPLDGMTNA